MEAADSYSETYDQPALTALFDLEQARQADSFDKCYRDIVRLLNELQAANKATTEEVLKGRTQYGK